MTLEYEVHNFDGNAEPRKYEAVYRAGDALILKVVIYQRLGKGTGTSRKPLFRWQAFVAAWTPGQSADSDWTQLAHLEATEITVRDVIAYEADEDTWLKAARYDAEELVRRAQPFADVLATAMAQQGGKRRGLKAAA